jgi:hypothetical protein
MKKKVFYLIGIIFLMVSCYPGEIESYEETDLVYTNYDDAFDFASKGKFSMPEKIVKITGNLAEGETPEYVKEPYNTEMLSLVKKQMEDLGWSYEDVPENADVVLFPAVWTNTTVVYWYDYWCWYYYYYCGWGYYYPYYSTYTTGTFVMALVPTDEAIEPASVWTAAINGLVSGNYNISRITNAIDQAFEQSPYLNTK